MIKVGMMIADRYEIIEKIGTGGMSDVYRAKDHKLNRFVAVKVLKQEFSENTDFVSKFRTEAQAAAGLMHPNIVNVYDVGEETGFHYIVMELVEGITLKKYIEKKARLSVKEAVSIAIQVSMGIESAHNNNIIHRDIKPQNIIISKDGKVKVTDFGIAKAATSNTITSNVMGSVHYTSPEQVRGGFSDEKSDIYSLGITLFEMLTGRVPFNGDTTVAVAIKHIQEKMPTPRDFVPEIPISVEQIVLKCTQKSPDKRYQSVPELVEDLKKSLISPDENFVKIDNDDHGGVTKNISKKDLEDIKNESRKRDKFDAQVQSGQEKQSGSGNVKEQNRPKKKKEPSFVDEYTDNGYSEDYPEEYPEEYPDDYSEEYPEDYPDGYSEDEWVDESEYEPEYESGSNTGSMKKPGKKSSNKSTKDNKNSKNTKSSNGKPGTKSNKSSKSKVQTELKRRNQSIDEEEYDPKMEFLTTILIVVAAVIIGCIFLYIVARAVGINMFSGEGGVLGNNSNKDNTQTVATTAKMPEVIGRDANDVEEELKALGLSVAREYQTSSEVELNHVINASVQPGTTLNQGETVTLVISSGETSENDATIPSVVGLSRPEATAKLEQEGFVVTIAMENSDTVDKNNVISQSPEAGSAAIRGASVEIKVSLGAGTIETAMPNLINMPEEDAIVTLTEKGLTVEASNITEEYSDTVAAGNICYQNYSAGVTINSSSEIVLKVSKGPEQIFYNCITDVKAPNDYAGGAAVVTLKGSDGTQLFSTTTDSFPVNINVSNIFAVATGDLYITYYVNEEEQLTDADGNITIQNVQVQKTIGPETITFTRAQ